VGQQLSAELRDLDDGERLSVEVEFDAETGDRIIEACHRLGFTAVSSGVAALALIALARLDL
jgi:hypothetical protein